MSQLFTATCSVQLSQLSAFSVRQVYLVLVQCCKTIIEHDCMSLQGEKYQNALLSAWLVNHLSIKKSCQSLCIIAVVLQQNYNLILVCFQTMENQNIKSSTPSDFTSSQQEMIKTMAEIMVQVIIRITISAIKQVFHS